MAGIKHIIAQKDIKSSNSKIEAVNKVVKHQFLFPLKLTTEDGLIEAIPNCIDIYNDHRPQRSLNGYTPNEAYDGTPLDYSALMDYLIKMAQNYSGYFLVRHIFYFHFVWG